MPVSLPRFGAGIMAVFFLALSAETQRGETLSVKAWAYEPSYAGADQHGWREIAVKPSKVQADDELTTARSSRAEVRLDAPNWLRVDESSTVAFPLLSADRYEIDIDRGVVYYGRFFGSRADVRLRTPLATAIPLKDGRYEVAALDDGQVRITVRRGKVRIIADDEARDVGAGRAMLLRNEGDELRYLVMKASPKDDWYDWNVDRDRIARTLPAYRERRRAVYRSWPTFDSPFYRQAFPGAW